MSTNTDAPTPAVDAIRPPRPKTVEYAVYVLGARIVIGILAAFAAYRDRPELTKNYANANKKQNWDAATLHSKVDAALKAGVITALLLVVVIGMIAFLIWQGKNGDVTQVDASGKPLYGITLQPLQGGDLGQISIDNAS